VAKVLFINPVVREEGIPVHVPYGIALLASITMEKGHLVQVYDANAWRLGDDVLRDVINADDWDVIALGGITTAYASIKQIVRIAKEEKADTPVVLGGGVLTSIPREILTWLPQVDIGVVGEAFETFPELLELIDAGRTDWDAVNGTISRDGNDSFIMSPMRQLIDDLDQLPFPAWELFPLEEIYFPNSCSLYSEEGMMSKRRLDINASYGCSMICRYCYHLGIAGDMRYEEDENGDINAVFDRPGVYTRTTRFHSPEYVVRLMKHAYETYKVDFIGFLDENLMTMDKFSGRTWMKEICDLMQKEGLAPIKREDGTWSGVHWGGTSHASLCTQQILKIMKEAGCTHLVYGYESFAPHVLKTIGKGATRKHNLRSFFWTLEAGIRPIPNMILGFPNEDFESIRENVKAWDELGIMVKPHFATPYPGSEWFTVYRGAITAQYGGDLERFLLEVGDASTISAVISHNFNAVELAGLREMMVRRDVKRIDEYEQIWRRNHQIEGDQPSTLYVKAQKQRSAASAAE
jgi:anaerobic magnesium-protoporphyrin IX monomethyl ester cyclase